MSDESISAENWPDIDSLLDISDIAKKTPSPMTPAVNPVSTLKHLNSEWIEYIIWDTIFRNDFI